MIKKDRIHIAFEKDVFSVLFSTKFVHSFLLIILEWRAVEFATEDPIGKVMFRNSQSGPVFMKVCPNLVKHPRVHFIKLTQSATLFSFLFYKLPTRK